LGVAVLSFDFSGLGNSEGEFEDTGFSSNIEDLIAADTFLRTNYQAPQMLIGHSLGGTAAVYAASRLDHIKAVVTIGSPANPQHVKKLFESDLETIKREGSAEVSIGGRNFKIGKQFLDDLENRQLEDFLPEMRMAFLFLHSPKDKIVSIDNAAELFMNAHHPKSFISLDGADHLLSEEKESKYVGELISTWSKKYFPMEVEENDLNGHQVKVRLFGESYTSEIKTPFHHLIADEPNEVGGENLGPTPYDLLMASLGTCTVMTLKMYAQRKKWKLDEIVVYLDHDKVHQEDSIEFEKSGSKISRFTRSLEIKGELTPEIKDRLLEIADKCPVHRTLTEEILIKTKFL
jgi:putative redox protein